MGVRMCQRGRGFLSLSCVAMLAVLGLGLPTTAAGSAGSGCPQAPPNRFTAPFSALPPVHEIPPSGELPFGPAGLLLQYPQPAIAKGEPLSYLIRARDHPNHVYRLGWSVRITATRIGGEGNRNRDSVSRRYQVKSAKLYWDPANFSVRPPSIGVYRVQISVADGRELGEFDQYVRVGPRQDKARLLIGPHPIKAGAAVMTRILDAGNTFLSYGESVKLMRKSGSGWEDVTPPDLFNGLVAFGVAPGEAGACQEVILPSGAVPGTYEVKRLVEFADRHSRWISAPFEVR